MTRRQNVFTTLLIGSFLMSSVAARAQTWSSVASVCQPGSDSIGLYAFNSGTLEFGGTNTGSIKARCPVINPLDEGVPNWTTLTVGYDDPDGTGVDYQVDAQLARTSKTTGVSGVIKTFDSSSFGSMGPASHSVTFSHTFDFTDYAYYVTLTVTRGDSAQNPSVWFVGLR